MSFKARVLAIHIVDAAASVTTRGFGQANLEVLSRLNWSLLGPDKWIIPMQYWTILTAWNHLRVVVEEQSPESLYYSLLVEFKACVYETLGTRSAKAV